MRSANLIGLCNALEFFRHYSVAETKAYEERRGKEGRVSSRRGTGGRRKRKKKVEFIEKRIHEVFIIKFLWKKNHCIRDDQ